MNLFASANMHISFVAEPVFHIGNFTVNNAMTLGAIGVIVTLLLSFYAASVVKKGKKMFSPAFLHGCLTLCIGR